MCRLFSMASSKTTRPVGGVHATGHAHVHKRTKHILTYVCVCTYTSAIFFLRFLVSLLLSSPSSLFYFYFYTVQIFSFSFYLLFCPDPRKSLKYSFIAVRKKNKNSAGSLKAATKLDTQSQQYDVYVLTGRARVRTCSLFLARLRRHFEAFRELPVHQASDPAAMCLPIMHLSECFIGDPSHRSFFEIQLMGNQCVDQDRECSGNFVNLDLCYIAYRKHSTLKVRKKK